MFPGVADSGMRLRIWRPVTGTTSTDCCSSLLRRSGIPKMAYFFYRQNRECILPVSAGNQLINFESLMTPWVVVQASIKALRAVEEDRIMLHPA